MPKYPPDTRLTLRFAGLDDLDDITTVAQHGFPDDPEFDYRVWTGPEMVRRQDECILQLSEQDRIDIVEAWRHFQSESDPMKIRLIY